MYQNALPPSAVERVPIEGGKQELVPASIIPGALNDGDGLSLSPDGKLLAFKITKSDTHKKLIALVNLDENGMGSVTRFLDADPRVSDHPEFTPDGKAVVYAMNENGVDNLWLQPLNGSSGHQFTNFTTDGIRCYRFSPEGKTLGVVRRHADSDVVLLRDTTPK